MKGHPTIAAAVFTITSVFPLATYADDGWYAALDLGQSHFTNLYGYGGPLVFNGQENRDHDTSYRLAAGYQFNPYFGLEAGYVDLGRAEADGHYPFFTGIFRGGQPVYQYVPFSENVKADGYVAEAVGSMPLGTTWALYGRLGAIMVNTSVGPVNGLTIARSRTDTSVIDGVGVSWAYSDSVKLRLGLDLYDPLGSQKIGRYSVRVIALGLTYSFR